MGLRVGIGAAVAVGADVAVGLTVAVGAGVGIEAAVAVGAGVAVGLTVAVGTGAAVWILVGVGAAEVFSEDDGMPVGPDASSPHDAMEVTMTAAMTTPRASRKTRIRRPPGKDPVGFHPFIVSNSPGHQVLPLRC